MVRCSCKQQRPGHWKQMILRQPLDLLQMIPVNKIKICSVNGYFECETAYRRQLHVIMSSLLKNNSGVDVAQSLVFCVAFCQSLFVFLLLAIIFCPLIYVFWLPLDFQCRILWYFLCSMIWGERWLLVLLISMELLTITV